MESFPFADYRNHFPIFKEKIQLSSCSQSAMSLDVQAAVQEYMTSWQEQGMDWGGWTAAVEEARQHFATLIHADVEEIAVVSSVSHAASSIATSLNFTGERSEIVLTDMDFPCIGHVWLSQRDLGASVQFISSENHQIPLESYENTINEKTLLTSISHVAYYNGFKQDLKSIAEIVHQKGSYLFVDAYQSAGNVPINVKESNVDFLAAGLQKYLLGIPGLAFLYIKKEVAEKLNPRLTGWFGQANPFAFDIKNSEFASGARRFDSGTPPMINGFAAKAALQIVLSIGMEKIEPYLKELSQFTIDYALEQGLNIVSPQSVDVKGSNTAIYIPNASEVEGIMKEKGVIVSSRQDVIRIAPHFYNKKDDIKQALDVLKEVIESY
ncbi:aminotransferase class V-fold PLP-dependent enzyme [Robertmurraya massiliosenegalensis]|uniref:aminotransferase class V-fold PLP-dependent enzyme n=1 Tax=Robertmurraya TaxID=2837507 RepID=UPI0039A47B46